MDSPGFSAAVTLISESVVPHIEYKKKKGKKNKTKKAGEAQRMSWFPNALTSASFSDGIVNVEALHEGIRRHPPTHG